VGSMNLRSWSPIVPIIIQVNFLHWVGSLKTSTWNVHSTEECLLIWKQEYNRGNLLVKVEIFWIPWMWFPNNVYMVKQNDIIYCPNDYLLQEWFLYILERYISYNIAFCLPLDIMRLEKKIFKDLAMFLGFLPMFDLEMKVKVKYHDCFL
jgi:hypothetical protein